jgi:hypothetical protein
MDTILDMLSHRGEHLIGRFGGPLNFRLIIMPLVVTVLAIRAHMKDVREGRPTELGAFFKNPAKRQRILRTGLRDVGRIFIVACVLDAAYQIWVLRSFYLGELLVVAMVCAVVPYFLVRVVITRFVRMLYQKWAARKQTTKVRADH